MLYLNYDDFLPHYCLQLHLSSELSGMLWKDGKSRKQNLEMSLAYSKNHDITLDILISEFSLWLSRQEVWLNFYE